MSHPARGAWIEINGNGIVDNAEKSHPARGAWIEISRPPMPRYGRPSHPARGAWIEICMVCRQAATITVAPRKGCVD